MSDKLNTGISITPCDIGVSGLVTLVRFFDGPYEACSITNSCLTPTVAND